MRRLIADIRRSAAGFGRDDKGALFLTFAVLAPLLVVVGGMAVDIGRAEVARTRLAHVVDSAALAGSRMLGLYPNAEGAEVERVVLDTFATNLAAINLGVSCASAPREAVDHGAATVSVAVSCSMRPLFPMPIDAFNVDGASQAQFSFTAIEVAYTLDVSGSMSGSKLQALKDAMNLSIGIFTETAGDGVRLALSPYASSVNLGPHFLAALGDCLAPPTDATSRGLYNALCNTMNTPAGPVIAAKLDARVDDTLGALGIETCIAERLGPELSTDAPVAVAAFAPAPVGCPDAPITPLTQNSAALRAAVANLTAGGSTAMHIGLGWSWYMVSSQWVGFWPPANAPAPNAGGPKKVVVLMSDGMMNAATLATDPEAAMLAMCENMRRDKIKVYTIAFQAPPAAEALLLACATSPAEYYRSDDEAGLVETFRALTESLGDNRIIR